MRRLQRFRLTLLALPLAMVAVAVPTSGTVAAASSNPWLARRPLVIAHRGGAHEAPSNTLYAFRSAMRNGADVLELDVHTTWDGHLVVIHDDTVDRTTGASGFVRDMTLEQLKGLDAAFCWRPGAGDQCDGSVTPGEYPFRGVATGQKQAPEGFTAADFRVPTLEEVLETVHAAERARSRVVLLMIEIKYNPFGTAHPPALPFEDRVAGTLAMAAYGRSAGDTIIASTLDDVTERFRVAAFLRGTNFSTAAPAGALAVFLASALGPLPGAPNPLHQVLAVPPRDPVTGRTIIDGGGDLVRDAHANGFAVHAWTINDRDEMTRLLGLGVDGIITDRPSELRSIIDAAR